MSDVEDDRMYEMRVEESLWMKVQGLLGMENRQYYDKGGHKERSLVNQPVHKKHGKTPTTGEDT